MKKLICAALSAVLLLSLTACGGNEGSSGKDASSGSGKDDISYSGSSSAGDKQSSKKGWSRMSVYGPNDEVYYWHEYEFGPDGKRMSVTSYGPFDNENGHVDFVYDNQGNRLVDYNTHGVGRSYRNGVLQPPELKEETGSVSPIEKEYDSAGNLIRGIYYRNGEPDSSYEYEYDDSGRKTSKRSYDSTGRCYQFETYEYDSLGNVSIEKQYSIDFDDQVNSWLNVSEYEYDSEGNELKESNYRCVEENGELRYVEPNFRYETEYTDSGEILKRSFFSLYDIMTGELEMTEYTIYYYNEQGATVGYANYAICEGTEMLIERVEYSYD